MNDYHDYVIKDGQFIGQFETMYRECDDPWHASKEEYAASACSLATKRLIHSLEPPASVVSLGCGTGRHLRWLECGGDGVDLSFTATMQGRLDAPYALCLLTDDILHFLQTDSVPYNVYLFREVLWYILPDWPAICDLLATKHGAWVIIELSFYDEQHYGKDYFDGPDDFIAKWPFSIEKIVREHTTKNQREGRMMIAGKVV